MPIPEPEKGITGFCPCCGAPRIYGVLTHDLECIWYEDKIKEDPVNITALE
jgi:hypothetical protein